MKRSRAEDAHHSTNPQKKRRITSNTSNKTKIRFKHKPSNDSCLSPAVFPSSSVLKRQQETIRNINSLLQINKNINNNALFYELSKYYFDDHIFKKLHSDIHCTHQNMIEFIQYLLQSIKISPSSCTEWISLLKFMVVTLKFQVEFIEQKANNDKTMFIKHCVPSNDLYKFNDKQRIKPFTKYYLDLLQQQNIDMADINRLYHKYQLHHSHSSAMTEATFKPFKARAATHAIANMYNNHNKHMHALNAYPVYGEREETERVQKQIQLIDEEIASIKANNNEQFKMCQRRLCETNDNKLAQIAMELEETEQFIKNKYECKETIINNEYHELIDRAKKRLLAKYQNKKSKQERLFKIEFARHQRKIEKAHKKAAKKEKDVKVEENEANDDNNNNDDNDDDNDNNDDNNNNMSNALHDILFKRDVYQRPTLLDKKTDNKQLVHFSNGKMQEKWKKICGIADREMESDVNTMVADQDKGLEIKDILSMFPKCDVSYKADKNILQIGTCSTMTNAAVTTLKVASYIACRYLGQSIMLGQVKSISSDGLWCLLRQKGDKLAQYAMHNIKVQHIEDGSVKIKLIH